MCIYFYIHSLRGNQIGDDGARCLAGAMESMTNLQML